MWMLAKKSRFGDFCLSALGFNSESLIRWSQGRFGRLVWNLEESGMKTAGSDPDGFRVESELQLLFRMRDQLPDKPNI